MKPRHTHDNVEFVNFHHQQEPKLIDTPEYFKTMPDVLLNDLISDIPNKMRELAELQQIAIQEKERREHQNQWPQPDRPA